MLVLSILFTFAPVELSEVGYVLLCLASQTYKSAGRPANGSRLEFSVVVVKLNGSI